MKVEVKTGARRVKHVDRFGVIGDRVQPTVEMWVDGVCFSHDCDTTEQARLLVIRTSYALGLDK